MKLTLEQWNILHYLLKEEAKKRKTEYIDVKSSYQSIEDIAAKTHVYNMYHRWSEVVSILDKLEKEEF